MKSPAQPQAKQQPRRAAAESERARTHATGSSFLDNRPESMAQRQLADAINGSSYMVTQLQQFRRLFGSQRSGPGGEIVVQRAEKWWKTNEDHTTVAGEASSTVVDAPYVKRAKAGDSDELKSSEAEAWTRAKATSLQNRPANTELFPDTNEKMGTSDGNRTYLTKADSKKAVTIIATHTTDAQSQVETETGDKLKVNHAHSASGNFAQVKPALKKNEHPAYTNDAESKVHYLSLTRQG